jgi:acetyl esterase/lipase
MGESAGATLAVVAPVEARARGLAMPGAAVLLTPWVDYLCSDTAYTELADADPCGTWASWLPTIIGSSMVSSRPTQSSARPQQISPVCCPC